MCVCMCVCWIVRVWRRFYVPTYLPLPLLLRTDTDTHAHVHVHKHRHHNKQTNTPLPTSPTYLPTDRDHHPNYPPDTHAQHHLQPRGLTPPLPYLPARLSRLQMYTSEWSPSVLCASRDEMNNEAGVCDVERWCGDTVL